MSARAGNLARVRADVGLCLCSVHKLRIKLEVYDHLLYSKNSWCGEKVWRE